MRDDIPPSIDSLLSSVRESLASEVGAPPRSLVVVGEHLRLYSRVWILEADDQRKFVLKWSPRGSRREFEVAALWRGVFEQDSIIQTPTLLARPTPHTLLVEFLPGRPLDEICSRPPILLHRFPAWYSSLVSDLHNLGVSLRRFHSVTLEHGTDAGDGLRQYVKERESVLPYLNPALRKRFLAAMEKTAVTSTVRVHGDFTPHNVLAQNGRLAVIDFAGIGEFDHGSPYFDVANMIVGLEEVWRRSFRNCLRFFKSPIEKLIQRFLTGYEVSPDDTPLLGNWRALRHYCRIYSLSRSAGTKPSSWKWHLRAMDQLLP